MVLTYVQRLVLEGLSISIVFIVFLSNALSLPIVLNIPNVSSADLSSPLNDGFFNTMWHSNYLYLQSLGYSDRILFTISVCVVHSVVFWGFNAFLYFVYRFNLFPQYKIQQAKYADKNLINEALTNLVIHHVILNPVLVYLAYPFFHFCGVSFSSPLPSYFHTLLHLIASFILNDTAFYWTHRTLHHRSIYKYIHKQHHRFRVSIGIAAEFAHPLEDFIANVLPTFLGTLVFGSHAAVMLLWLAIRLYETVDTHSGYRFPISPCLLVDGVGRHDFHHSHIVGCFGSTLIFWDWLCGTDKAYHQHLIATQKTKVVNDSKME